MLRTELFDLVRSRVETVIADIGEVDPQYRAAYIEILQLTLERFVWPNGPDLHSRLEKLAAENA